MNENQDYVITDAEEVKKMKEILMGLKPGSDGA